VDLEAALEVGVPMAQTARPGPLAAEPVMVVLMVVVAVVLRSILVMRQQA
jgi:hypothetical protein